MFDFRREPNTRPLILDPVTGTIVDQGSDRGDHGHDSHND
jgi:phospholipase C